MRAALLADGARPDTFWKTAYKNLMWYEPVGVHYLPHVFDFNAIEKVGSAWNVRATTAHQYMSTEFGVPDARTQVDRLMSHFAPGRQRQNYTGTGLSCIVSQALDAFIGVSSEHEVPITDLAPGAKNKAFYSGSNKVDLLAPGRTHPALGISNKWSLRNDRDTEVAHQASFVKAHAKVRYFVVVTNEFGIGRLKQLLDYDSIDGIYHLNRTLLEKVHSPEVLPNGRLRDVSTLFADAKAWTA